MSRSGSARPRDERSASAESLPSLAVLRAAARSAWPEGRLRRFRVHEEGWANLVLEADDRIMFRFPRRRAVAEGLGFELRALELLRRHLSAEVPDPVLLGVLDDPAGWPFIAYRKVPGRPLSFLPRLDDLGTRRLERFIGQLLDDLAAIPSAAVRRIGGEAGDPGAWARRYRRTEQRFRRHGAALVPADLRRAVARGFDDFYRTMRATRFRPVALHRDLGADHLLWDTTTHRPTGVIDWEDLALGDPAFDLTALVDLGPVSPARWTAARRAVRDRTFDTRLDFYRRVRPIYAVIHAAETGDRTWLRRFLPMLRDGFRPVPRVAGPTRPRSARRAGPG